MTHRAGKYVTYVYLYPFCQEWFIKDLTICIVSGDPECNFSPSVYRRQQLSYFCGNALECRLVGSRPAYQMAKENIERHYSVVGVTEDYASTLKGTHHHAPVQIFSSNPVVIELICYRTRANRLIKESNTTGSLKKNWTGMHKQHLVRMVA